MLSKEMASSIEASPKEMLEKFALQIGFVPFIETEIDKLPKNRASVIFNLQNEAHFFNSSGYLLLISSLDSCIYVYGPGHKAGGAEDEDRAIFSDTGRLLRDNLNLGHNFIGVEY